MNDDIVNMYSIAIVYLYTKLLAFTAFIIVARILVPSRQYDIYDMILSIICQLSFILSNISIILHILYMQSYCRTFFMIQLYRTVFFFPISNIEKNMYTK